MFGDFSSYKCNLCHICTTLIFDTNGVCPGAQKSKWWLSVMTKIAIWLVRHVWSA